MLQVNGKDERIRVWQLHAPLTGTDRLEPRKGHDRP
jgi:hypothetical protein